MSIHTCAPIRRRRRQCVVSEDHSVAPELPNLFSRVWFYPDAVDLPTTSADDLDNASSRHGEICWERGRPDELR